MTYIQSGNIIFKTEETDPKKLTTMITEAIEKQFSFSVPVLILKKEEMETIITENPFLATKDIMKLHVTLLDNLPEKKLLDSTRDEKYQSDEFIIKGTTIYLYCPDGYGMTKFSTTFFEKKLGVQATTRNWKTMNATLELMNK